MNKVCTFAFNLIVFTTLTFISCKNNTLQKQGGVDDFKKILEKDTLTIITLNTSTSYFIYKEEPMGYDYDLIKDFCDDHELELNVKVAENNSRLLEMLINGEGDLIAYQIPVQTELKDEIIYAGLEQISHQVLIQRANKNDTILTDVTQLIGKKVYTLNDTKYHQRLVNLNAELGGGIILETIQKDTITPEDMIEMVSLGEIRYTVCDANIAKLNKTYYRNINISLPISFEQRSSWAVRKDSPQLAKELDEWFAKNDNTPIYKSITKKYYELSKASDAEDQYVHPKDLPKGVISPYDELFKKHAKGSNYDWHLIAAISYHESRFQNNLTSWAGASGIMGLMPRTARSLGLSEEDRMNPDLSINAGIDLLDRLDVIYKRIDNKEERLKFILAAYNAGNGHINDARALAKKYGANPNIWEDNVKKYLELKSHPEYYTDSICKNGYFRAGQTTHYVDNVMKTAERFKKISK